MKVKLKEEKRPEQQQPKYPEPDQIERLFEAWAKGGKEALVKELKASGEPE